MLKISECLSVQNIHYFQILQTFKLNKYSKCVNDQKKLFTCFKNCVLGFAHFLTSTCFAELGSRIPKTGSAYIYAYAVLGELIAFVVGWSLLLEHIMAASMAAKGMNYLSLKVTDFELFLFRMLYFTVSHKCFLTFGKLDICRKKSLLT